MSKAENKELQLKNQKAPTPGSEDIELEIKKIFSVTHRALNSDGEDAYVCFDENLWKILPHVEAKSWQESLWGPKDFEIHLSSSYYNHLGNPVLYEESKEGYDVTPREYLLKRGRILYQIQTPKGKGKVITASLIMMENNKVRLKFFFAFCNGQFLFPDSINLFPHLSIYAEDPRGLNACFWSPILNKSTKALIPLTKAIFLFFSRISEGDPVSAQKFTDAIKNLINFRYQECQNQSSSRTELPSGITYDSTALKEYRSAWKQTFFASFREAANSFEKGVAEIIWDYIP